ncbi:probable gamma-soluble NSF attachment protein [Coccomyxa sp. Obi]|nr:probable gamma-soluble NSF attachment protein [Coccomyxa sp. Obi]
MALSDGNADFEKAEKLCKPSVLSLRLKADWETATPLYERAAASYRLSKSYGKARDAFEKAATGHHRQGSPWHSAKNLEKAADMAKESGGMDVEVLYRDAARAYLEAGRTQAAAEALARAARHLEGLDPKAASQLYMDAVETLEDDGKEGLAGDLFRQAIGGQIRMAKYAEAVGLLLRFALACHSLQLTSSQCKAYLGAVVVWLFAENASEAWAVYQDAMGVDSFASSDGAFAAEALFDAYRSGDAEEVRKCIQTHSAFMELDNQIVRLAKKLPQGDVRQMAASLGSQPSPMVEDHDEEDLT